MSEPFDLNEYEASVGDNYGGTLVEDSLNVGVQHQLAHQDAATQIDNLGVQDLGLDNAVSTARVRKPTPKLDADRLLNPYKGYPSLLRDIKRLRYQKGTERKWLQKYVMTHQIWANRVWPKANFDDFIVIARRVGKDPRVRSYIRDLIESEKYSHSSDPRGRKEAPQPDRQEARTHHLLSEHTRDLNKQATLASGPSSSRLSTESLGTSERQISLETEASHISSASDSAQGSNERRFPEDREAPKINPSLDEFDEYEEMMRLDRNIHDEPKRGEPGDDELEAARDLYGDLDF